MFGSDAAVGTERDSLLTIVPLLAPIVITSCTNRHLDISSSSFLRKIDTDTLFCETNIGCATSYRLVHFINPANPKLCLDMVTKP